MSQPHKISNQQIFWYSQQKQESWWSTSIWINQHSTKPTLFDINQPNHKDQSLRAWLCGGDIVRAKTSRIAHMWRTGDRRTEAGFVEMMGCPKWSNDAGKNRLAPCFVGWRLFVEHDCEHKNDVWWTCDCLLALINLVHCVACWEW